MPTRITPKRSCACRASAPTTRGRRCPATRRGRASASTTASRCFSVRSRCSRSIPRTIALFARVLAAVPTARLVFFEGRHPKLTAKFRSRIAAVFARDGIGIDGRVVFLGQCGHDDFLRVNAVCDAMLDTQRWSGGNTSLDALAAGLPIVTLPGRFMRGRQSAAMLALAGVDELVAADANDYVGIAERIAVDSPWRASLRARIRERNRRRLRGSRAGPGVFGSAGDPCARRMTAASSDDRPRSLSARQRVRARPRGPG